MPGALDGIRILDFSRYQQGPFATVMLSDLGADVIKVEERGDGDVGRRIGLRPDGWCAYFEAHNRNKRSITIDVRKPQGREIIYKLVPELDVIVDNFRPGVMERLQLDLETLRRYNAAIITASATGFGERGTERERPAFDSVSQAIGGIMVNQGGGPGRPPLSMMGGAADQIGAMVLALGIAAAIIARERQGLGQHVEASLLGSQLALQAFQITDFLHDGFQHPTPQRQIPTFAYYPTADGKWLSLGIIGSNKWWPELCDALGRPDLRDDPRFADPFARDDNREALLAELDAIFARRPRDEWIRVLEAAGVPCGPVNDYAAVVKEPQVLANDYVTTLDHPALGTVGVIGSPITMSETPAGPRHTGPELGQHTEEILLELGYSWDDIVRLKDGEVI